MTTPIRLKAAKGPRGGAEAVGMKLSLLEMLCYVLPAGAAVGILGAYPSWRMCGTAGLKAEAAAGAIVLCVMAASGIVVVRSAGGGAPKAAMTFLMTGLGRALVCLGLAAGALAVFDLAPVTFCLWVVGFYWTMFASEVFWFSKALRGRRDLPEKETPNCRLPK